MFGLVLDYFLAKCSNFLDLTNTTLLFLAFALIFLDRAVLTVCHMSSFYADCVLGVYKYRWIKMKNGLDKKKLYFHKCCFKK